MAMRMCSTCGRATLHLGGSCTDHSELKDKPHPMLGKVLIPAYEAKVDAPKMGRKIVSKPVPSGIKFKDDDLISDLLGLAPTIKSDAPPTDKLICSFCGKPVNPLQATQGMAKPRMIDGGLIKTYDDDGKIIDFETRIFHVADRKTACPDCVLNLRPLFKRCPTCKGKNPREIANCPTCKGTKEGDLMHNGVEFPQSEG